MSHCIKGYLTWLDLALRTQPSCFGQPRQYQDARTVTGQWNWRRDRLDAHARRDYLLMDDIEIVLANFCRTRHVPRSPRISLALPLCSQSISWVVVRRSSRWTRLISSGLISRQRRFLCRRRWIMASFVFFSVPYSPASLDVVDWLGRQHVVNPLRNLGFCRAYRSYGE